MNEFKIYQVKSEALRAFGFRSLASIRREHPAQLGLPREAWELVYIYRTNLEPRLESLYRLFQRGAGLTPINYRGRSMSVSDIIETPDGRLWFCDSIGWKEIQWVS